jgi:predicted RNA-binding protein
MAQIGDEMAIYTEGIMEDGACILRDGEKVTITEILEELNAAAGNVICDGCGEWIQADENNCGIDCNLHERCADEFFKVS